MKISEILGKELINESGDVFGYVRGIYACRGKIEYLACADGDEREFDAHYKGVAEVKGKLVFTDKREKRKNSSCVRLGIPAYTQSGKSAGFIKDIIIDNGEIKYYLIGSKRYTPDMLEICDVVIIRQKRVLKEDVVKDGQVILKKGTEIDCHSLNTAQKAGEYIQAQLKSI